jgi:hypothetical protein
LSTTNPTWPDPGLNPGRRGGKPATNRFSYGAAVVLGFCGWLLWCWQFSLPESVGLLSGGCCNVESTALLCSDLTAYLYTSLPKYSMCETSFPIWLFSCAISLIFQWRFCQFIISNNTLPFSLPFEKAKTCRGKDCSKAVAKAAQGRNIRKWQERRPQVSVSLIEQSAITHLAGRLEWPSKNPISRLIDTRSGQWR